MDTGSLEFQRKPGGVRIPSGAGQTLLRITVLEASRAHERTPKGREIWSVNPSLRIVVLRTPDAELEWAVTPEQRDWALARLNGSSGE